MRFLNGAEVEVLPANFSASLPNVGTVKRQQVRKARNALYVYVHVCVRVFVTCVNVSVSHA